MKSYGGDGDLCGDRSASFAASSVVTGRRSCDWTCSPDTAEEAAGAV